MAVRPALPNRSLQDLMPPGDETLSRPVAVLHPDASVCASERRAFVACREDEPIPDALAGAVAAIGNFDGVHRGHRALLRAARAEADGACPPRPAVALTFEPHPRTYFAPDQPLFRLTSLPVKELLFARLDLDGAIVRRFDARLAETGARDFVGSFLTDELGLSGVVVGHDFRFGRGREGDPALLAALCAEAGLSCRVVPAVPSEPDEAPVSSSAIRAALGVGDVARANALLGYRWITIGTVRHGDKRGRTLGFPTANLALASCGLAHGIYAVRARLADGSFREGVASYGRRPTFDDGRPLLEVNLFAFSGDLYGATLAVEFLGFIRAEARFESAEALIERMHVDAAEARVIAAANPGKSMLG